MLSVLGSKSKENIKVSFMMSNYLAMSSCSFGGGKLDFIGLYKSIVWMCLHQFSE